MSKLFEAFSNDTSPKALSQEKTRIGDAKIWEGTKPNVNGLLDAATMIPVAGDALSGALAVRDALKGDYGSAAMNAVGVLPFIGGAGMINLGAM